MTNSQTESILVVDDDQILLEFVEDVLGEARPVLRARDGAEAVAVFKEQSDAIGLVLLDLGLPEMSGYAALVEMLIINPDVKVIVITGLDPDMQQLSGVQQVLTKPFLAEDLKRAVDEVLSG